MRRKRKEKKRKEGNRKRTNKERNSTPENFDESHIPQRKERQEQLLRK